MVQEKIYYNISELAEMFDIAPSTIRFWEKSIPELSPNRVNGIRQYNRKNVQLLKTVYYLIKDKGLKIEAVKRYLASNKIDDTMINVEIVERLQKIKASIQQTIMILDDDTNDNIADETIS